MKVAFKASCLVLAMTVIRVTEPGMEPLALAGRLIAALVAFGLCYEALDN
jgi:hypothetical protein